MNAATDTQSGAGPRRLKVPWFMPMFNAVTKPLLRAGVPFLFNGLLTVPGRKTGLPRTTAVALLQAEGRRWVWAPWGETDWVKNLRAAGRASATLRKQTQQVSARELDQEERAWFFENVITPFSKRVPLGYWL